MITAKPVSLNVRPFKVSNLCFEVGGILGESFTELGAKVSAFDFRNLYRAFREANLSEEVDPGRIRFDSDGIDAVTKTTKPPSALAALRAETVKAALNRAINVRANAVFTKYGNAAEIIALRRKIKSDKGTRITSLSELSERQATALRKAYEQDLLTVFDTQALQGVIRTTFASIDTTPGTTMTTTTTGPGQGESSTSTNKAAGKDHQEIETRQFEYRTPHFENLARNERAQISLGDESVSHFMETHYLDRLEEVFKNELASIDADINQLQVAYLNTILMSPIDGIITGVYKNPGDSVGAGEPVFRVEDNSEVLLIANVICRGLIPIGSKLQVETPLFDAPNPVVRIEADIVAARGQRDNENWEVIAKCSNLDANGKIIFPLGYNFDYDNTEVNILGADEN